MKKHLTVMGFSDREVDAYIALLRVGPLSVRKLAEETGINRGTTYDVLKALQEKGAVCFYHKEKKQYFAAEDPAKLRHILKKERKKIEAAEDEFEKIIPELRALYDKDGERPVVRYYDKKRIHLILQDVLDTTVAAEEKTYYVYSAATVRESIYESFENFSKERIDRGISVNVIALGKGGDLRGLDKRKWLRTQGANVASTYILIYPGKVAFISLDALGDPVGVIIENQGIHDVQKLVFNQLWQIL